LSAELSSLSWLIGCLFLFVALTLFQRPVRFLFQLALRTGVGLACLSLFAPIGQMLGAHLGVNLLNSLVLGVLGVPGFGLLLMLRWALR